MPAVSEIPRSSLAEDVILPRTAVPGVCSSRLLPFSAAGDGAQKSWGKRHPRVIDVRERSGDVALLVRIAQRDATAFAELYDKFSGTMFAMVVRIVGSRPEAEDVLQIGFQQVWHCAAEYDGGRGSPFAWMVAIMRHRAIDALRARRGQLQRIDRAFQWRNDEPEIAAGSDHLLQSEQCTAVRKALSRLSADERKPIELAFFDGLTHLEIAQTLGDPIGTIKARIRRGMLKLRPALATFANFPVAA